LSLPVFLVIKLLKGELEVLILTNIVHVTAISSCLRLQTWCTVE